MQSCGKRRVHSKGAVAQPSCRKQQATHQESRKLISPFARRMGTHPSGPAVLAREPGLTLRDWLKQSPGALGPAASRFSGDLPFLFKVPLSCVLLLL